MSYGQYANSGRSLGRILHELSTMGVSTRVVEVVCLQKSGSSDLGLLSYHGEEFATFTWTPDDRPVFTFTGYGAQTYTQLQERRSLEC